MKLIVLMRAVFVASLIFAIITLTIRYGYPTPLESLDTRQCVDRTYRACLDELGGRNGSDCLESAKGVCAVQNPLPVPYR